MAFAKKDDIPRVDPRVDTEYITFLRSILEVTQIIRCKLDPRVDPEYKCNVQSI